MILKYLILALVKLLKTKLTSQKLIALPIATNSLVLTMLCKLMMLLQRQMVLPQQIELKLRSDIDSDGVVDNPDVFDIVVGPDVNASTKVVSPTSTSSGGYLHTQR